MQKFITLFFNYYYFFDSNSLPTYLTLAHKYKLRIYSYMCLNDAIVIQCNSITNLNSLRI